MPLPPNSFYRQQQPVFLFVRLPPPANAPPPLNLQSPPRTQIVRVHMKNEAWGGRWQAAAPQASGAECSLRAASRLWSPSLAKSVNDPGCHLINTNKQQMSHIIVSPGGRCQAVTWKKKKCLCECERVCRFYFIHFSWALFLRSARRMKTVKGRLYEDSVWRVLLTLWCSWRVIDWQLVLLAIF